ncbi:hypothetical protein [uncultured Sneathiella sp.]|uniref:hypothetical protein n=1 Tax=uncultured Sneathiella sp. TaxID=879315 RepID=UPI0030D8C0F6|tara:strand:+ start:56 stop:1798 length:1743 start_codon:yes stop_codon:yes gene_type:complete
MTRFANIGASSIFLFLAFLLTLSRLAPTGYSSPVLFVLVSILLVLIVIFALKGKSGLSPALFAVVVFFSIIFVWSLATRSLFDPGYDGYSYHLSAIWDIGSGWNPFLSPHNNIWVDSYPNGYWTLQSYVVALTGILMSGQALSSGLTAAVALLAYGFFLGVLTKQERQFPHIQALLFAGITVANPVVFGQLMTHYVDGPLYLFGTALVLFLVMDATSPNRLARWSAICCIILMVNTKTAALYYTPLIVFGGFVFDIVRQNADETIFRRVFYWIGKKGFLFGFAFILGVIFVGYKPYVTNVVDHGELLYPSVDRIMDGNSPSNVIPLPVPLKFVYGIFSRTEDSSYPIDAPVELKIPGAFSLSEFKLLQFDTRRGGFGPFFSLALVASILAYLGSRQAARNKSLYSWRREGDAMAAFAAILFVSSMFFPESWWARYIPFIWLSAVMFAATPIFLTGKGILSLFARVMSIIALLSFIGCVLAGTIGSARQMFHGYKQSVAVDNLKDYPVIELSYYWDSVIKGDSQSNSQSDAAEIYTQLFESRGIRTEIVENYVKSRCEDDGYLFGGIIWCSPKKSAQKASE